MSVNFALPPVAEVLGKSYEETPWVGHSALARIPNLPSSIAAERGSILPAVPDRQV